jgi:formate dehydrogenase subunit gamma
VARKKRRIPPAPEQNRPTRILRFDRVQRAAHWANAVLFGILILTALPLYFGSVERIVGRHVLIAMIHLWAGVALPIPIVISLLGPWGARMRRDVVRISRWTEDEVYRFTPLGLRGPPSQEKFNPGQKLNAIFIAGSIVVMLATGIVLKWFGLFPLGWRSGATFVHEVLAFVIVAVVIGHLILAFTHRDALRSMVKGWVTTEWAEKHARRWLNEQLQESALAEEDAESELSISAAGAAPDR